VTAALTLTEARALAWRVLQYGYFADDDQQRKAHARCPYCRRTVTGERFVPHHTDSGRQRLLFRALTEAVVQHLREDCDATPGRVR
jgi:hypothetical protein